METLCGTVCALAILLFGMALLGGSLEELADGRRLLRRLPSGGAFLMGAAVTAAVQSSSAVTALVVSARDKGTITRWQAEALIAGANVGTTSTAWLLALGLRVPESGALLRGILGSVGIGLYLWPRGRRPGGAVMGLFLVLSGMDALTAAAAPLADSGALAWLCGGGGDPLGIFLAGALLSGVLQSSGACLGFVQAIAAVKPLALRTAAPVLAGINVGTCSTSLLASLGCGGEGRRTALFHLTFNLAGTALWAVPVLAGLLPDVPMTPLAIAAAHTVFNLTAAAAVLSGRRLLAGAVPRGKTPPRPKAQGSRS